MIDKRTQYYYILGELRHHKNGLTARQLAKALYMRRIEIDGHRAFSKPYRQEVAPRLTELCQEGKVIAAGKIHDAQTDKAVTVYRILEKENV